MYFEDDSTICSRFGVGNYPDLEDWTICSLRSRVWSIQIFTVYGFRRCTYTHAGHCLYSYLMNHRNIRACLVYVKRATVNTNNHIGANNGVLWQTKNIQKRLYSLPQEENIVWSYSPKMATHCSIDDSALTLCVARSAELSSHVS